MRLLVTGGSACGKSTYAESVARSCPRPVYYLATMRPNGDEALSKIARHRAMRAEDGFITVEKYIDLHLLRFEQRGTLLLECMCNLVANVMFDEGQAWQQSRAEGVYDKITDAIGMLSQRCDNLIVVTNDVGSDCRRYEDDTGAYIEMLGRVNQAVANDFDTVVEVVCGIPLVLKGFSPTDLAGSAADDSRG